MANIDKISIVCSNYAARSTFYEHFYMTNNVKVAKDFESIESPVDCVIIPCSNTFGHLEGVSPDVRPIVNSKMLSLVKNYIFNTYCGDQPVGTAFVLPLPDLPEAKRKSKSHGEIPLLSKHVCWVAVSRGEDAMPPDFGYNGIWSALCAIKSYNKAMTTSGTGSTPSSPSPTPEKNGKHSTTKAKKISSVACPFSYYTADSGECCRQMSIAIKNYVSPVTEPYDEETGHRFSQTITKSVNMTTEEREKELEGLLWSREIETRGLCNEEELDILVAWVNRENDSHNATAAKALVTLLQRPDSEFTMAAVDICEKITSKTGGCLPKLLEMGVSGQVELHKEIQRSELEILGKVGDGNTGSVYRAMYNGAEVAVKMFAKSSQSSTSDFIRELSLLSIIKHPLVLHCYGGCTKPNEQFIVVELMEASVYDILHDDKFEIDEELKLHIAISTAKSMNFLHTCGIIHRDLKSLNLLVSKNYDVKICDFGLSRVVDTRNAMTSNIGTVAWIAPELFAKKIYTEKADVYSYGIILWELWTRLMPFHDVETFSVPVLVSRGERPDVPKDMPLEWRKLMKAAWNQKPTSRPSFKKILSRLREMLTRVRDKKLEEGKELMNPNRIFLRNSTLSDGSSDKSTPSKDSLGTNTDSSFSDTQTSSMSTSVTSSSTKKPKPKRTLTPTYSPFPSPSALGDVNTNSRD